MRSRDVTCVQIEDLEQRLCLSSNSTAGSHHAALLARHQARTAKHALQAQRRVHRAASTTGTNAQTTSTSGVTYVTVTDLRTGMIELVPVSNATGLIVTTLPTLDAFGNPIMTPAGFITFGVGSTGAAVGALGAVGGTEALQPIVPPGGSPFGPPMLASSALPTSSLAVIPPISTTGFATGNAFSAGSASAFGMTGQFTSSGSPFVSGFIF
jgi:hypothetical protein